MTACTQKGFALMYASTAMKDDREVVLAACTQNGAALGYAGAALRDDHQLKALYLSGV